MSRNGKRQRHGACPRFPRRNRNKLTHLSWPNRTMKEEAGCFMSPPAGAT